MASHHPLQRVFSPAAMRVPDGLCIPVPKGQIALGFNCAARDYSEDDRQLFTLLRPHLMQAYVNALTLTRITTAMTGMSRACVVAGPDGMIEHASARAIRLLQQYFDLATETSTLPPQMGHWLL